MVTLKANFEADWVAHLRNRLVQMWGPIVEGVADDDIPLRFFDSLGRKIAIQPRALKIADDFSCPVQHAAGWMLLQEKVRRGDNLTPHLSIGHTSPFNADGLLAEWQVHHFHLGAEPYSRNPNFIDRSGHLVFALVDAIAFHAINVYRHGDWEDVQIVESIHRNWPDAIRLSRVNSVTGIKGEALEKKQRRNLRKYNVNVAISTSDGTTYMALGGGTSSSGVRTDAIVRARQWRDEIKRSQIGMERLLSQVMPALPQQGYSGENEIDAKLQITGLGDYQVLFPRYGAVANLSDAPMFRA
jgi:hypothetical protein